MLVLLFIILLLEFFTYWLFEPIINFSTNVLAIRFIPWIALIFFMVIFSAKND